jgi:hypothetical protein
LYAIQLDCKSVITPCREQESLLFFLLLFVVRFVDAGVVKVAGKEGGTLFRNSLDNTIAMDTDAFRLQLLIEAFVVLIGTDWSMGRIVGTLHGEVNTKELVGFGDAFVRPTQLVERQLDSIC